MGGCRGPRGGHTAAHPLPGSRRDRQPPAPHLPDVHQPLARPRALPGLDHFRLGHAGERWGGRVPPSSSFAAGWEWDPPFSGSLPENAEHHTRPAPSPRSPIISTTGGKRDAAGPRGAFPRDPAARWAGLGWASSPVAPPGFAGGRRLPCLRRWTVWKHFRDYFPVKVRPGRDGTTQKAVPRSRPRDPFCPRSW